MRPEELRPASFRKKFFFVGSHTLTGGRKTATKTFVNSDRQVVEDLGLRRRSFSLSGIIAARRDNSGNEIIPYVQARDELLAALEKEGTGILVHPFLGEITEPVACLTYSLDESETTLGEGRIQITFAISDTDGLPQKEGITLSGIVNAKDQSRNTVANDIKERFSVTASFTGNFSDAIDKVNETVDEINEATSPAAIEADKIDEFNDELSDITTNVASLVSNPADLSDSLTAIFETMNGLYATPEATLDSFVRLFDFGDSDTSFSQDTAGRIERQKNRNVINDSMQVLALTYAYLNATQIDLATVDDIDEQAEELEDQFQKIIATGTLVSDVEEKLVLLRIDAVDFFDIQRVTKPQVITVRTNLTTTRLLAFQYYGSSELGDTLAELNDIKNSAFIEGDVQILTA